MQLIRGRLIQNKYRFSQQLPGCVATIGNFDGIHLGHQKLLSALQKQAQLFNLPSVVISFEPPPQAFLNPQRRVARLMRLRDKLLVLKNLQIDYFVCLNFDKYLANCSAEVFIRQLLVRQLGIKALIVGDDFRFGAKRQGDFILLQQLAEQDHFQAIEVSGLSIADERISSTRIRNAILADNLELAKQLLGRPYFLAGRIIKGDQRGRQLGFPTANISLGQTFLPVNGIYTVQLRGLTDLPIQGVASVGNRPMFPETFNLLEVYLLDFNADIYGQVVEVDFLQKIREALLFTDVEQLVVQMRQDVKLAREYFGK